MNLEHRYGKLTSRELLEITEDSEYTHDARELAYNILKKRKDTLEGELKEYAIKFHYSRFEKELNKSLILSQNKVKLPESKFLDEKELKEIFAEVFTFIEDQRKHFYKGLPMDG